MHDTEVSPIEKPRTDRHRRGEPDGAGWLLLIHRLPAEPAYLRVKTLRRLRALGAVALKGSVYVLPDTQATREDLEWLRREILAGGGEATIASCRLLQGATDDEVIGLFRAAANEEYAAIEQGVAELADGDTPGPADVGRLRRRLEQIRARDHFQATGRMAAERALIALGRRVRGEEEEEDEPMLERPRGVTWVTREDVYVDRMASGWLIRRFIDPAATFRFVAPEGYAPEPGELRFDMFEGEFTHEGDRCTFETLLLRFGLQGPGLESIAEIVHEIDCKDDKYARSETSGVVAVLDGIVAGHPADRDRMEAAKSLFDGLYERFRSPGGSPQRQSR